MLKSNSFLRTHRRNTNDVVDLFFSIFAPLSHLNTSHAFGFTQLNLQFLRQKSIP